MDESAATMEEVARRYARRILLIHLGLLILVAALVSMAGMEVYARTREQIVHQAEARQELLGKQTASAIRSFYESVVSDLRFLQRSEDSAERPVLSPLGQGFGVAPPRLFRPLWSQLEGRASQILYLSRGTGNVVHVYPEDASREEARRTVWPFIPWLKTLNDGVAAVSPFRPTREGGANLIAVPLNDRYALAAVIPVAKADERFLAAVRRDRSSSASLIDEDGVVMATTDWDNPAFAPTTMPVPAPISAEVAREDPPANPAPATNRSGKARPPRRVLRRLDMAHLIEGTTEYDAATPVAGSNAKFPPRLTTVERVTVEGRTFYIVLSTPLAEITGAVNAMFTRALVGAIIVILAVTGILVSTALRLIRSRRRLEIVQRQMLSRELDQAREIQLNWLPGPAAKFDGISVAAVNQTANHISGDFYDFFKLPDGRVAVTIGDVTGHGMSAAFMMAATQLLVRTTLSQILDPGRCLESINRQLCSRSFHGQFVTILVLVFDPHTGEVTAATAGHMPPLVDTGDGFTAAEMEPQMVLGVDCDASYSSERFVLGEARLLLYTDGVLDAQHAREPSDRFRVSGLQNSLASARRSATGAGELIEHLVAAISRFRGTRALCDDVTMVAVDFAPRNEAGLPRSRSGGVLA